MQVQDGQKAVEAEAQQPFDVVLMDLDMPVMDGVEACKRIQKRCSGNHSGAAVVFLTSHASDETLKQPVDATTLRAGVARVDITDHAAGPVNDPSYVKALAISNGKTTAVIVTVDAVAIGGIGRIGSTYLPGVRTELKKIGIEPENIIVNASHCHSTVRGDTDQLTVQAVKEAVAALGEGEFLVVESQEGKNDQQV